MGGGSEIVVDDGSQDGAAVSAAAGEIWCTMGLDGDSRVAGIFPARVGCVERVGKEE